MNNLVKPVTVSEFRKHTKIILDQAKTKEIYVARNWELYKLTFVGDATLSALPELRDKLSTQPTVIPGVVPASQLRPNPKTCKIHNTPLTQSGKCLQKGCKYS